jgi:transposase
MTKPKSSRVLEGGNLSEMFGIEIVERPRKNGSETQEAQKGRKKPRK